MKMLRKLTLSQGKTTIHCRLACRLALYSTDVPDQSKTPLPHDKEANKKTDIRNEIQDFWTLTQTTLKRTDSKYLKMAAAGVVGAGVSLMAAPLSLGMAGFTSVGIAKGSMAAWWMSVSGPIAQGSLFALSQSAGATGCISAGSSIALGAAGGSTGAGVISKLTSRQGKRKDESVEKESRNPGGETEEENEVHTSRLNKSDSVSETNKKHI